MILRFSKVEDLKVVKKEPFDRRIFEGLDYEESRLIVGSVDFCRFCRFFRDFEIGDGRVR